MIIQIVIYKVNLIYNITRINLIDNCSLFLSLGERQTSRESKIPCNRNQSERVFFMDEFNNKVIGAKRFWNVRVCVRERFGKDGEPSQLT